MPPRISVVVPLYNEADNVAPLASRILRVLGPADGGMELLLVDDASTDTTWEEIMGQAHKDTRVVALRHNANKGQSAALWTGFTVSRGEIIATLDGDLQNDPADLPI